MIIVTGQPDLLSTALDRLAEAAAARRAAEHEALLAAAPSYVLPNGTAWRSAGMLGRLRTGHQGDQGRRLHVVREEDCDGGATPALCGARPGLSSVGWGEIETAPATCPRCLARLARTGL